MKKVTKYECSECKALFNTEQECLEHENRHERIKEANAMLEKGYKLQDIQEKCNVWTELPKYLKDVNKDNCFIIPQWQLCSKAAYKIEHIYFNGNVKVTGCGSWEGYYTKECRITSDNLEDPRPSNELFVDERYINREG